MENATVGTSRLRLKLVSHHQSVVLLHSIICAIAANIFPSDDSALFSRNAIQAL